MNKPDGVVTIKTDLDIEPIRDMRVEFEKAADAAERMSEAVERVAKNIERISAGISAQMMTE